jgi:hypothetical protein
MRLPAATAAGVPPPPAYPLDSTLHRLEFERPADRRRAYPEGWRQIMGDKTPKRPPKVKKPKPATKPPSKSA